MTRYDAALGDANVRAFLAMIRVGEGTSDPDGYRRHFGGELFDSFAAHPRRAVTRRHGTQTLTSTAAGAYQFLTGTWDECRSALDLPDFSPASQDAAAVFLIDRRGALADVLAGRISTAIAKCAKEWASLPGSPYGQPTRSLAQALETYRTAGGVLRPAAEPAPVETRDVPRATTPTPAPAEPTGGEISAPGAPPQDRAMPIPAIVGALLPSLIEAIPKLGALFGSGSKVAERNVAAASVAMEIVKTAVGASNEQDAVERIKADPAAAAAAARAVEARWYDLTTEAGGGGIEGARAANAAYSTAEGPRFWFNPAFWISSVLLAMPFMLLVDVLFVHPTNYTGDLRTQIVTAVLVIISMVGAYWIGTSFSSARKTDLGAGR